MKHKKQLLQFLEVNHCMINSLMSREERKTFGNDVVGIIEDDIRKQIERDEVNAVHKSTLSKRG